MPPASSNGTLVRFVIYNTTFRGSQAPGVLIDLALFNHISDSHNSNVLNVSLDIFLSFPIQGCTTAVVNYPPNYIYIYIYIPLIEMYFSC